MKGDIETSDKVEWVLQGCDTGQWVDLHIAETYAKLCEYKSILRTDQRRIRRQITVTEECL